MKRTSPWKRGDAIEISIAHLDENGAGVDATGQLHVAGALPGERVRAVVGHVSPHGTRQVFADTVAVLEAAAERVPPPCPAFGTCGGCDLQHLAVPAQDIFKQGLARDTLGTRVPAAAWQPHVPSPRPWHYRNQAKFVYGRDAGGEVRLGSYAPRSHTVVNMAGLCRVLEPPLAAIAADCAAWLRAHRTPPWDATARPDGLRYVLMRVSAAGAVLVTLVCGATTAPGVLDALAADLMHRYPAIRGVTGNANPGAGDALLGPDDFDIRGVPWLEDEIAGVRVRLSARSFFQLNRHVAAHAYGDLARLVGAVGPVGHLLDAYAGVGVIAAAVVAAVVPVTAATCIEVRPPPPGGKPIVTGGTLDPAAFRYLTGDVAACLGQTPVADVVVLNPPRAGCAPAVRTGIAALKPRLIVYLSCNLRTLARDLDDFAPAGYAVTWARSYDMLPHTTHVETLVALQPGGRAHRAVGP